MPTGNPQEILRIRRIRELQSMVPEFVNRTGGSNRQSALPTGSNRVQAQPAGSKWLSAMPASNPQEILRIRRIRELQSMVPEFVNRTGGSNRQSALPTGSNRVQAQPAGSKTTGKMRKEPFYG